MLRNISNNERDTILLALRVAGERFKEDAEMFRKIKDDGGTPLILPDGAMHLENQFNRQSDDCFKLLKKIGDY